MSKCKKIWIGIENENADIRALNIKYDYQGTKFEVKFKDEDIILLHGWGQNIEMMKPLGDHLEDYHITILDFPGFGESSEPNHSMTIYDS